VKNVFKKHWVESLFVKLFTPIEKNINKYTSYRTGIYPHMPIADHREIQIVYNTGHHRPCGGLFLTPRTVHRCPASLSH